MLSGNARPAIEMKAVREMGWFSLSKTTGDSESYSLARGGDRVHLAVNASQVAAVVCPEGGAECVLRTSDGKEYEVRNSVAELLGVIENPLGV